MDRPTSRSQLAAALLFISAGVTAHAASSPVTIVDPKTPTNAAHVAPSGALLVSGTVTVQQAVPNEYFHTYGFPSAGTCLEIASPPSGKALIVRQIRVDTYLDPSPGDGQNVSLYTGTDCDIALVGDVNPPTVGQTVVPFDPGLAIAAGSGFSVLVWGSVLVEIYLDGYLVPSGTVADAETPAVAPVRPPQRRR